MTKCLEQIREEYETYKHGKEKAVESNLIWIRAESDIAKIDQNTRKVHITVDFTGELSHVFRAIGKHRQINSLTIDQVVPFIMLDDENLREIKYLYMYTSPQESFVPFEMPALKNLTITCCGANTLFSPVEEPIFFDFSFLPELRSLCIKYWANLDPLSFKTIHQLERFRFVDEDSDSLDWLKFLPSIEMLEIESRFSSAKPIIDFQQKLQSLSCESAPEDVELLTKLQGLKYLSIHHCQISPEQEQKLRAMDNVTLVLNQVDRELLHARSQAKLLCINAAHWLYDSEINLSRNDSAWAKAKLESDRCRSWEEKALDALQFAFVRSFNNLYHGSTNPVYIKEVNPYRLLIHQTYIKTALADMPFLVLNDEMTSIMNGIEPESYQQVPRNNMEELRKKWEQKKEAAKQARKQRMNRKAPETIDMFSLLDSEGDNP